MAKKNKRRNTFPEKGRRVPAVLANAYTDQWDADKRSPGPMGYFREIGVRETLESLLLAVLLALLFRAFESEAFIIPTGSMAPSLNGQHYDLECNNCQLRYHSGTTTELNRQPNQLRDHSTYCPVCQYPTRLSPNYQQFPDHRSNKGDRILVNKFIYDFAEPARYDVIVFKNPNNGKQNYIKRLIGLPGDNLAIEGGDIYLYQPDGDQWKRTVSRKESYKLRHTLQIVDDTAHIGKHLQKLDWPLRWQSFDNQDQDAWQIEQSAWQPSYTSASTAEESWLRYRHYQPRKEDWQVMNEGLGTLPPRFAGGQLPPGGLITDQYAYNDLSYDGYVSRNSGFHWVGDIGMEIDFDVANSSGQMILEIVEGGIHMQCVIDLVSGGATLKWHAENGAAIQFVDSAGQAVAQPSADTGLTSGEHRIMFVNADDQLHLWVDGAEIKFDAATYTRNPSFTLPYYSATDAGDSQPLGVGSQGAQLTVSRLKVLRDIYYTSATDESFIDNESGFGLLGKIYSFLRDPNTWESPAAKTFFSDRRNIAEPMFQLKKGTTRGEDQFLPMGDNSPNSLDGRFWTGHHYVQRNMLIGRAGFVFWPHTVNNPFPLCPNFWEMGFIK